MFLGANIDTEKEAEKIGIARNRSVTYENNSEGIVANFKAVDCEKTQAWLEDDWKKEIETYRERNNMKRSK